MSLNPSTWNVKMVAGYVLTALVVIALARPICELGMAVLKAIHDFVPGIGK